ncbi:MAG: N-6 DNA methylase [Desulfobulbaceae bacterium]|nr:N-6 DNA methylase [Desulfobulbaceae bacterium]
MKRDMLQTAIEQLDFNNGQLFNTLKVSIGSHSQKDWLDKGDWLRSAHKAGVEHIFFVENNPVAVFARSQKPDEKKISVFNKIWCLSRPRLLFLESEGELSVIDLAQPPIRRDKSDDKQKISTLEILTSVRNVARKLQEYHRDNIESGKVFEHGRFGDLKHRADQALIADLRTVRAELIQAGLSGPKMQYAHALIGRSIFIRYLEDRGILTAEYFSKVVGSNLAWQELLQSPCSREKMDFSGTKARYPRVLQDKDFTYALFRTLSIDFNGDMFPNIDEEESLVDVSHLQCIQELLYGDAGPQKKLFFFSYQFDIIPLDLISAIYEEFYHTSPNENENKSNARQYGAYYTPPALAEFILSRVLTHEVLQKNPRILDPACGSGIFLVEAFRRIVRYRLYQKKSSLSFSELTEILGRQIAGIEVNEEAARITAFSLYLAMLHYLDPPSILSHILNGEKLPNLIASANEFDNHYNSIHVANAFSLDNNALGQINVVVGNPPWGASGNNADKGTKERQRIMMEWCKKRNHPIGDKEPSQAFLWRSLDFLRGEGQGALLASAGVLFKHSSTTQAFRREWMSRVCITEVFNFIHVRKFFFKGADSPFVMIHFKKGEQGETPVEYWSLKQVASLKKTQSVLLSKYDRAYLIGQDLTDNKTWKSNWFGRHADVIFFHSLKNNNQLESKLITNDSGRGYQSCGASYPKSQLGVSRAIKAFELYSNKLDFEDPPANLSRLGCTGAYRGAKIIVHEGIFEEGTKKGRIIARYEDIDFAFYRSIYGLKLKSNSRSDYLLITGILCSSFARYYFFNTTANWGLWNHKILLGELMPLPLPSKLTGRKADQVIFLIENLQNYYPQVQDLMHPDGVPKSEIEAQRLELEAELDEAVFDLYGFTQDQRDLIRDCCEVTLPFFYQPYTSVGAMPAVKGNDTSWINNYAERFAHRWQPYLNQDEVLRANLHIGASGNMVAMEFYPADLGDKWELAPKTDSWGHILEEIGKSLPRPMGTSQILLDGIVHVVTDNSIIVIKHNEKRFWTRSLAREDAESTLAKRMLETMPQTRGVE